MLRRLFLAGSIGLSRVSCSVTAVRGTIIVAALTFGHTRASLADSGSSNNNGDDFIAWLKKFADRRENQTSKFNADDFLDSASRSVAQVMENGVVGKVGYGFMMGYASGLCIKKVLDLIDGKFSIILSFPTGV